MALSEQYPSSLHAAIANAESATTPNGTDPLKPLANAESATTDLLKLLKCDKRAAVAHPPSSPNVKAVAHASRTAKTVALPDSNLCNEEHIVSDKSLVVTKHAHLQEQYLQQEPKTSHEPQAAAPHHAPRSIELPPDYAAVRRAPSRNLNDWLVTGNHHAEAQLPMVSNHSEAKCTAATALSGAVKDPNIDMNSSKQHVVVQRVVNGPFGSIREASRSSIAFVSNASAAAYIAAMQRLQARRQQLDGD